MMSLVARKTHNALVIILLAATGDLVAIGNGHHWFTLACSKWDILYGVALPLTQPTPIPVKKSMDLQHSKAWFWPHEEGGLRCSNGVADAATTNAMIARIFLASILNLYWTEAFGPSSEFEFFWLIKAVTRSC